MTLYQYATALERIASGREPMGTTVGNVRISGGRDSDNLIIIRVGMKGEHPKWPDIQTVGQAAWFCFSPQKVVAVESPRCLVDGEGMNWYVIDMFVFLAPACELIQLPPPEQRGLFD